MQKNLHEKEKRAGIGIDRNKHYGGF